VQDQSRTPALVYVGLRTVIEWKCLPTWTRVIVGEGIKVIVPLEISGLWRAN